MPPTSENDDLAAAAASAGEAHSLARPEPATILGFARHTHEYIREYIQLADQKAAFIFAAGGALLAFLYSQHASDAWLTPRVSGRPSP